MKKILIIEDDPQIAMIQRDYLAVSGFEPTVATTGTQGLELGLSQPYDLIILDLMLPEMDCWCFW